MIATCIISNCGKSAPASEPFCKPHRERKQCDNCANYQRGYRIQGFRMPSSCNRHFRTISGDDPACSDYVASNMRDNS